MSAIAITKQVQFTEGQAHYVLSNGIYNASGDTFAVPTGSIAAAVLVHDSSRTAPTSVSITQGASNDTITLTGGTTGFIVTLITRHTGGPASGR
jgi:hypothetical protein